MHGPQKTTMSEQLTCIGIACMQACKYPTIGSQGILFIYISSLIFPFFLSPIELEWRRLTNSPAASISRSSIMVEKEKQGEVMWPRLVANKLLRRPVGTSSSFVADFPCNDSLLEFENFDEFVGPKGPLSDQKDTRKYKVFVSTWNVGGILPSEDLNLEDWLDIGNNYYDIYVLGFQEIVPLSAKNVLGPEKRKILARWNSLIRRALNKSSSDLRDRKEQHKAGEKQQKVHPFKEGGGSNGGVSRDFRCIVSKQMVGVLASVWVRRDLQCFIRHPSVSCVGCGIMGCLGNKGSVAVRFFLHETSFCFVCCHLASGGKEGDEMNRNSDATEILSRTSFPRGPFLDLPQKILDHDRVILLGDLNYRISMPEAITRSLVEQKKWNMLLDKDQLRAESSKGRAFANWQEGVITFSPTYKYYPNSDNYYGCIQGQKGEKRRAPAWCDRILWHGEGIKQKRYDRCESRLSDHRPVRGVFAVNVDVPRSLNSLGSFFFSERFHRLSEKSELLVEDEQISGRRTSIHTETS